jgi:hypothetical protein
MGNNTPLGNTNNPNWNLPVQNPNAPATPAQTPKAGPYQSGFPDIDAFLNTSAQYAANTINTMGINLNTTNAPIETLFKNNSINTQGLFTLLGNATTGVNNNIVLGNNISSFAPNVATVAPQAQAYPTVTTNGNWNGTVLGGLAPDTQSQSLWQSIASAEGSVKLPVEPKTSTEKQTGELTMEQLFAQVAKPAIEGEKLKTPPTEKPLSVADILQKSSNAVAGPTGGVFGRATNTFGLPEATTPSTNNTSMFASIGGFSKEKTAALTMLSNQYPELAQMYLKDTADKAQKLTDVANKAATQGTTTIENMPAGFNQLLNASVQPAAQLGKADDAQRAETMKLIADAQKLTSKDVPPTK